MKFAITALMRSDPLRDVCMPLKARLPALLLTTVLVTATVPVFASPTLLEQAFALDVEQEGKRDAAAAAALYQQAANDGDAFAHLRLGFLYETGDGVPQDYAAARLHYEAAVASGLPAARTRLAICHLAGWGGPVDRAAFVRELRLAGEAGDVAAQRILAEIHFIGLVVAEDREEGLRWLKLAAKQEDSSAQYLIGRHMESARTLMRDMSISRDWYRLSAEQEYQAAMRAMARTFMTAPRSERNWALGYQWLELASETGDAEAPFILAFVELFHPDSPVRDEAKARAWLDLAAGRGHERAREVLSLAASGQSLTEALRYTLSEAADDRYVGYANRNTANQGSEAQPPRMIRAVHPIYPQALRVTAMGGNVQLEFVVNVDGKVVEPRVVQSDHPLMSEAALEAVVQWEFKPGEKDGRRVNTRSRVSLRFDYKHETLDGVDGLLSSAAFRAESLGTVPVEDYRELRMAKFQTNSEHPTLENGEPLPTDSRALLIACLDANGKALRAYSLIAEPETVGPALVKWLLRQDFQPRSVDGKPEPSNVVFGLLSGKYSRRDDDAAPPLRQGSLPTSTLPES